MKLTIFGLTISSSWGNGHASIWRGLCSALARRGHQVVFFERDVPYYARSRDYHRIPGGTLVLYSDFEEVWPLARRHLADSDVGVVTSYCPDGVAASRLLLEPSRPLRVFYDMDTPVTLQALESGRRVSYLGPRGLQDFELALSYTGGVALQKLQDRLGAPRAAPLYGCVDPEAHHPVPALETLRADLSYLGTYAEDRQAILEQLFIEPARRCPERRFLIGGSQYPEGFPWTSNIYFLSHVRPAEHPAFYCSSRITLNVTRGAMARMGYCPSGRLFEAAACGAPILSDSWEGLDAFFAPGTEILIGRSPEDTLAALQLTDTELRKLAGAARERALAEHTAEQRVQYLEETLAAARQPSGRAARPGGES